MSNTGVNILIIHSPNKSPDAPAQRHKPFVKGNTTATMKLCALLSLCVLFAIGLDGNVAAGQKPAKPFICQHVNHNTPGNCQMSNLGPNCDYCYEEAEIPQVSTTWGKCKQYDATPGTCRSQGYPVCCHSPLFSEPNKLRLAFWNKPGTICASLPVGNVPCPDNGNPIIGAVMEYRDRQRKFRESRQENREKERERQVLRNPFYRPELMEVNIRNKVYFFTWRPSTTKKPSTVLPWSCHGRR